MRAGAKRLPGRLESALVPELVLGPEEPADTASRGGGPIRTGRDAGTGRCWIVIDRVGRFAFAPAEPRVHAHPRPGASPAVVRAAYLATALPLALQAAGHHLLHASAVETPNGVVAFCGRSGAGKSTLARALARRGFSRWADDAVWFDIERETGERPAVRTRRLPFGRPASEPVPPRTAPLAAVYRLDRRNDLERPTCERLTLTGAFPALLDNAYHFPAAGDRLDALAATFLDLATAVPTLQLTLPDDLDRLDETLDELDLPHGLARHRRTA